MTGGILRAHWPIVVLVTAGAILRLLAMVAYAPALMFPDSWGYVATAFSGGFVELPTLHPIGYPLLVKLLTLPHRNLAELVAFQHLAGLGVGVAVYAALIRARLPRWAATAAAALVLLDGYTIALEQYVMSDTFFTAALLAAVLVISWPLLDPDGSRAPSPRRALVAGLLLAAAALIREVAPFTIPIFLIYLLWLRAGWRPLAAFIVAAAVPLLAYSALIDYRFHVFSMTAAPGWTLYGRVAGFADCGGVKLEPRARKLCETAAQRASHPDAPDWYIWGPSPAQRLFHPASQSESAIAPTNRVLESFSRAMILNHPLDFAGATLADFTRYFSASATPYNNAVSATSLPVRASAEAHNSSTEQRDLPGLDLRVQSPAGLVRGYRRIFHVPRPVLAILALVSLVALCVRVAARREIFMLTGSAVLVLLGTAATGGFALRYLMPAVPLLAIGGSLAIAQVLARIR